MLLDAICISSHLPLLFYQQHRCWLDCTQHFHIFFKYSLDGPYYLWEEEEATFLVTDSDRAKPLFWFRSKPKPKPNGFWETETETETEANTQYIAIFRFLDNRFLDYFFLDNLGSEQ